MKKLLVLVLCSVLLFSCDNYSGKRRAEMSSSLRESYELSCDNDNTVTDMKIVYEDRTIQIRTYKLDGHDRIIVRSMDGGISDNHSEICKKCYEDPYN